jgi:hypothetical protein
MSTAPKGPPRFVPTLTEVVRKPAPKRETKRIDYEAEGLVQRVVKEVELSMEQRLGAAIDQMVLEQMETLRPLLKRDLETLVRHAVNNALQAKRRDP